MAIYEEKIRREGLKRGIYILPNLITTANLFCGFFAVIRAIKGDYVTASWIIILAGVFDFMDGRLARFTKTSSEFGLEYDSITDVCSFGLAPAILIYTWTLSSFERFGWSAAFLYFACGALRLARFNVQSSDVEKKAFQGLPIPAGAGFLASYIIMYDHVFGGRPVDSHFVLVITVMLALLMVSNISYRSFKVLDRRPRGNFFLLVMVVGGVFLFASLPQIMFFAFGVFYVGLGITEEIMRSPQKIKSFADFMSRYFHARPSELVHDEENEKNGATVVEIGDGKNVVNFKDGGN